MIGPYGEALGQKENIYQGQFLIGAIDEEGCRTSYNYNGAGRLIEETKGDQKTAYSYDPLGRKCKEIRWCGDQALVTCLKYDNLDRVIQEETQDKDGIVKTYTLYTYDGLGNKTIIQEGNQYNYFTYDTQSQLLQTIDAENHVTKIVYDYQHINALGQRVLKIETTDPKGQLTIEVKDSVGRISSLQKKDPFGLLLSQNEILYDPVGNVKLQRDDVIINGSISSSIQLLYEYNAANQIIKQIEAVGTPEQKTTQYIYNSAGQLTTLIKPNGIQIHSD